jgi:hypothetical protein
MEASRCGSEGAPADVAGVSPECRSPAEAIGPKKTRAFENTRSIGKITEIHYPHAFSMRIIFRFTFHLFANK